MPLPVPVAGIMPGDLPGTRDQIGGSQPLPGVSLPGPPQQPPTPPSAPSQGQGQGNEGQIAMAGLFGQIGGRLGQAFDQTRGVPTTQPVFDLEMSKAYLDQASQIQAGRQKRRQEDLRDAQQVMKLNQDLVQQGAPIRFVVKQDGSLGVQQISGDQANQERGAHLRRMAFDAGVPVPPGMDVSGNMLPQGGGAGAPPQQQAPGGLPGGQQGGAQVPPGGQGQQTLPPGGVQAAGPNPSLPGAPQAQGSGIPQEFTLPQPYGLPPKVVRAGDPEYAQLAEQYVRLQKGQQDIRTGQQVQQQNDLALQGQQRQNQEAQRLDQAKADLRGMADQVMQGAMRTASGQQIGMPGRVGETGTTSTPAVFHIEDVPPEALRALKQRASQINRADPIGALVDSGFAPDEAAQVMGEMDPKMVAQVQVSRTRFDKSLDDLQKAVGRKVGAGGLAVEPSKAEVDVALQGVFQAASDYNASLPKTAQFDPKVYVDHLRALAIPAPPRYKVGDKVTLKNGETKTIKTVNPDGTYE